MNRIKRDLDACSRHIMALPVSRFGFLRSGTGLVAALLGSTAPSSLMAAEKLPISIPGLVENQTVFGLSVFLGLVLFATVTSVLHIRGRTQWHQREAALVAENNDLRLKLDRAGVFLSAEPQIVIAWGTASGEPDIEGDISLVSEVPIARRVLGFGSWLPPGAAQEMDHAVERLRERGEGFRLALLSSQGRHLEAEGRAIAGRAILRIRDVSGDRLELTRLRDRHTKALTELATHRSLLDALPQPAWLRDPQGKLTWVSQAYARAVEAKDSYDTVHRGLELLDAPAREAAKAAIKDNRSWKSRLAAVIAGERRAFDVVEVPSGTGSAGFAQDMQELETARADIRRLMEAHARTLDQMQTAVAIFDGKKQLVFYNAAYRHLWGLDSTYLDQHPGDGEILDRLRAEHRLPEQADFRAWKQGLLGSYQALDPVSHSWFLPDGRNLRVVANPNSQGGVTYLYDDVTQAYALESKYNALNRVQSETLDTLREGVAVFGSDGRLSLFNPALAQMWRLDMAALNERPHFDAISKACKAQLPQEEPWQKLRAVVTGLGDMRVAVQQRLFCASGMVLDCTVAPLPDGASLLTFSDVTASVGVERALVDRNQALEEAETLRNNFVRNVSYELRSPLNSIVGFVTMLDQEIAGPLNQKQRDYIGHVTQSTEALMAIIDNILDLASIDAGAMELKYENIDIAATIEAAAKGVQDRLSAENLHLKLDIAAQIGTFRGDAKRIRQILFNLLSNAIGFSSAGQTITLSARRLAQAIEFRVIDQGRGIPGDVLDKVFDRFSTHSLGSRHRGVGLGLSLVRSFVDLHGGEVSIESAPAKGTCVTCLFPLEGALAPVPQPEVSLDPVKARKTQSAPDASQMPKARRQGVA